MVSGGQKLGPLRTIHFSAVPAGYLGQVPASQFRISGAIFSVVMADGYVARLRAFTRNTLNSGSTCFFSFLAYSKAHECSFDSKHESCEYSHIHTVGYLDASTLGLEAPACRG